MNPRQEAETVEVTLAAGSTMHTCRLNNASDSTNFRISRAGCMINSNQWKPTMGADSTKALQSSGLTNPPRDKRGYNHSTKVYTHDRDEEG